MWLFPIGEGINIVQGGRCRTQVGRRQPVPSPSTFTKGPTVCKNALRMAGVICRLHEFIIKLDLEILRKQPQASIFCFLNGLEHKCFWSHFRVR